MGSLTALDPGRIRRKAKRSEKAEQLKAAKAAEATAAADREIAAKKEAERLEALKKAETEAAFKTLGAKRERFRRASLISTTPQGVLGEASTGRRRLSAT